MLNNPWAMWVNGRPGKTSVEMRILTARTYSFVFVNTLSQGHIRRYRVSQKIALQFFHSSCVLQAISTWLRIACLWKFSLFLRWNGPGIDCSHLILVKKNNLPRHTAPYAVEIACRRGLGQTTHKRAFFWDTLRYLSLCFWMYAWI